MNNKIPYTAPKFKEPSFNCPICNAYAKQTWFDLDYDNDGYRSLKETYACFCSHCHNFSVWHFGKMIYPDFTGIELPNNDLDDEIKEDYLEAASIVQKSPRGAAALLRLVIQKLCVQLGEGKDLNIAIGNLVKQGLPVKVQQSLDALRVVGNESVHPGKIDLRDDLETTFFLFRLVNFIAEKMITEPKQIEEIYNKIPEDKKEQINERDKTIS